MITFKFDSNNEYRRINDKQLMYFIHNLKGNWVAKITRYGNIKFCESDEFGNPLHQNIFYTLYFDWSHFYFRRTCPSGQYQLFRKTTYKDPTGKSQNWWHLTSDWKHFENIEVAVAYFNQYYERTIKTKHPWTHYSYLGYMHDKRYAENLKLDDWKNKF